MHRFFCQGPFELHTVVELDPEQSRHAAKVLRLKSGAVVGVMDGQGHYGSGPVAEVRVSRVGIRIEHALFVEPEFQVQVCFGIPKGQALDFIFRRLTELGVRSFQPLYTRYSAPVRDWNAERWQNVVREVCKQCEQLHFPEILPPADLSTWSKARDFNRQWVVCDESDRGAHPKWQPAAGVDLVVGPEGGFDPAEIQGLVELGASKLGLGKNRLRAETAALVGVTLVKHAIGEI